ncbi:MAG: DUF1292 domain-containing protein [Oscillospiraceae bacterium]|jgi:uncharacterized protein YrzB (UPF0473 family)|nr:DUF1292 domain-containing protein [Oscillospiraceae bacterium]
MPNEHKDTAPDDLILPFRAGDTPEELGEDVLEDYGPDIISVLDENNKEHVFEELDRVDLDSGTYVALVPLVGEEGESEEESDELILLRVDTEDEEIYLSMIEDEDEFDMVGEVFSQRLGFPFVTASKEE